MTGGYVDIDLRFYDTSDPLTPLAVARQRIQRGVCVRCTGTPRSRIQKLCPTCRLTWKWCNACEHVKALTDFDFARDEPYTNSASYCRLCACARDARRNQAKPPCKRCRAVVETRRQRLCNACRTAWKWCNACKRVQRIDQFSHSQNERGVQRMSRCKTCDAVRRSKARATAPDAPGATKGANKQ